MVEVNVVMLVPAGSGDDIVAVEMIGMVGNPFFSCLPRQNGPHS
jgi:hypothetical protein